MPTFDVDHEPINVFAIDDTYLFKQYFEQDEVFGQLRQYYNPENYRFEVPKEAFASVQELLEDHFYEVTVVEDVDAYCVVKQKYSEHPDMLFRTAVVQQSKGEYNVFLLTDQVSVEQAVTFGAQRLSDTDLKLTF